MARDRETTRIHERLHVRRVEVFESGDNHDGALSKLFLCPLIRGVPTNLVAHMVELSSIRTLHQIDASDIQKFLDHPSMTQTKSAKGTQPGLKVLVDVKVNTKVRAKTCGPRNHNPVFANTQEIVTQLWTAVHHQKAPAPHLQKQPPFKQNVHDVTAHSGHPLGIVARTEIVGSKGGLAMCIVLIELIELDDRTTKHDTIRAVTQSAT